ncbi:MAG: GTPase HflX [Syntrophothermaceae bacterium]|jgi:GTP-binding protein HflX
MPRRAFLVAVVSKVSGTAFWHDKGLSQPTAEESLEELGELVTSRGDQVVGQTVQMRTRPDPRFLVGKGKVSELTRVVEELEIDVVVFDDELSPAQTRNLEEALGRPVLDRTAVILEIFAERAHSREGKLQVELARLQYLLPRLTGKGLELSRLGGGIGTRGPGEQVLEFERRQLRLRISQLEEKIEEMRQHRGLLRQNRLKNRTPVAALVGYTNAGKSTLLRSLTGDETAYVDDRVFATLDPRARTFCTPRGRAVLLTDTVGFIRKLPHQLVAAFRTTLEEVLYADVLLHVVDASRPGIDSRIAAVNDVLREIGAADYDTLLVFNKIDRLEPAQVNSLQVEYRQARFISARENLGLDLLTQAVENVLFREDRLVDVLIPYDRGDMVNYLYERGLVMAREERKDGLYLQARCDEETLNRMRPFLEGEGN